MERRDTGGAFHLYSFMLAAVGRCWPLLAAVGRCWPVIEGCSYEVHMCL